MNPLGQRNVSILIPTHNRCDILAKTLDSLNGLVVPAGVAVEVIVVANGCTDRTLEVARSFEGRLKFPLRVVEEDKLGLNHARNRAIREARHDTLAFLDDDVLVDPAWLTGLLEAFEKSGAGMIGGKVELWWEAVKRPEWMIPELEVHLSRLDLGPNLKELDSPTIVGANFALTRRVSQDTGEFRPDLDRKGKSLISGGETDFINRARAKGHTLYYAPDAALRHWVPPHRAELSHLLGIVAGKSASWVLMMPTYGPVAVGRSIAGGASKVLAHRPLGAIARMRGDTRGWLLHRMQAAAGVGQLQGCFIRLKGGA